MLLRSLGRWRVAMPKAAALNQFSTAAPQEVVKIDKEALSKLRKRTGYSFVNCRKALLQFGPEQLAEAEKWLHDNAAKEGWAKAAKLSSRATTQGLVGLQAEGNVATLVELSCETDFVARGEAFKKLLEELTTSMMQHAEKQPPTELEHKIHVIHHEIDCLSTPDGRPLREVVAMAVGSLGENIAVRSLKTFRSPPGSSLFGVAHPKDGTDRVPMGRFAALIALKRIYREGLFPTEKLAYQICQHIIGMRSESLNDPPAVSSVKEDDHKKDEGNKESAGKTEDSDELNEFYQGNVTTIDENETALLRQAFMLNPRQTVASYLKEHEAEVLDFIRLELGGGEKQEN